MTVRTVAGWTVRTFPDQLHQGSFKIIAVSPSGKHAIHRPRLTADQAAAFNPTTTTQN